MKKMRAFSAFILTVLLVFSLVASSSIASEIPLPELSRNYASAFPATLQSFAGGLPGSTENAKKAIYILPGYLGSELYDSTSPSAYRLWPDIHFIPIFDWLQREHVQLINNNRDGSGEVAFAFGRDVFPFGKDDYGAQDTYKKLVDRLKFEFGTVYDVKFFPYNWLGDINETVKKLEADAAQYSKIVLVTHSTGGLVAAAYISKNDINKQKVEKAVLIAPPLYGTYAALFPLERGDSTKGISLIDLLASNKWVRQVTYNSPTTYQLLPSQDYFTAVRALDLKTKSALLPWLEGWFNNAGWNEYYKTLNGSEFMNENLLSSSVNPRSHKNFRENSLNEKGARTIIDTLRGVDTTILGMASGKNTPMTAQYDISKGYNNAKLIDVKYDKAGDGTVYSASLGLVLDETRDTFTAKLPTYNYTNLDHTKLISHGLVLDRVVMLIGANAGRPGIAAFSTAEADFSRHMPWVAGLEGMDTYVKLRLESAKDIITKIYDDSGNLVAYCDAEIIWGFDGDDFICDQFGDNGATLTSIYLPKDGYKASFYCGGQIAAADDLSVQVNLLNAEGDIIGYGDYTSDVVIASVDYTDAARVAADVLTAVLPVAEGEIFTLDMTAGVDEFNIETLASTTAYPALEIESKLFTTGWELDFSAVNKPNDVVVLDNIGATATIGLSGDIDPSLIVWHSSDETVVTVEKGMLIAVGHGRALITAAATDGSGKSRQIHVKVTLSSSSVAFEDIGIAVGERSVIYPLFDSERVTEKRVDYSYDDDIIRIEDGVVVGLKPGIAEVTGLAAGGVENAFFVTVKDASETINAPVNTGDSEEESDTKNTSTNTGNNSTVNAPANTGGGRDKNDPAPTRIVKQKTQLSEGPDIVNSDTAALANPFADLKDSDWFFNSAMFVYSQGLMVGTGADPMLFCPNLTLTRGMVVTVLYRIGQLAIDNGQLSMNKEQFSDVTPGAWYYDAVVWAYAKGIVAGFGDGKFGPQENITREQFAVILYRYCQWKGSSLAVGNDTNIRGYQDASSISEYALPALQWACGAGIVTGKQGGYLDPQGKATRAEAAAMLQRFVETAE